CVFFFQAEDGIRDYKVTGVQTCALPISIVLHIACSRRRANGKGSSASPAASIGPRKGCASLRGAGIGGPRRQFPPRSERPVRGRSEERRVGKEGRSRWAPEQ